MRIDGRNEPPPHEYWVPDFTDANLPFHPDGRGFAWPGDREPYVDWLLNHLETAALSLSPHHIEIVYDPRVLDWEAERLGDYIGHACFSQFYWFDGPRFDYPADFLSDPRPERVCDPARTLWDGDLVGEDGEIREQAVDLATWVVFDFLFWRARLRYDRMCAGLPPGTFVWPDVGWRPLLQAALLRAGDRDRKRAVLTAFFDAFEVFNDPAPGEAPVR